LIYFIDSFLIFRDAIVGGEAGPRTDYVAVSGATIEKKGSHLFVAGRLK